MLGFTLCLLMSHIYIIVYAARGAMRLLSVYAMLLRLYIRCR